ncbi:hypothetical protein KY285_001698 [Solanum tuberosum]|nr:hypothetical protein KY289_001978 [Solanum tuberosum]KAH0765827.1 hypothetical protein KY285_001698 [Solanum tuberosum]
MLITFDKKKCITTLASKQGGTGREALGNGASMLGGGYGGPRGTAPRGKGWVKGVSRHSASRLGVRGASGNNASRLGGG